VYFLSSSGGFVVRTVAQKGEAAMDGSIQQKSIISSATKEPSSKNINTPTISPQQIDVGEGH